MKKNSLFSLRRVNDWLLKINDVDLTNKDRKQVIKAVLSGEGMINMVVRRRKSLGGRIITPIQINLAGHKGQRHREIQQMTFLYTKYSRTILMFKDYLTVMINKMIFSFFFCLASQTVA